MKQPKYLTIPQLAERMGFPERTIRRWHTLGALPFNGQKIGGRIFFSQVAVARWEESMQHFDEGRANALSARRK